MAVANSLGRSPTKWAVGLIALLVAYTLLQPQLNQRLGWNLPSLADLQASKPTPAPSGTEPQQEHDAALRYGLLRLTGHDEYLSPAGLRYTPGSLDGHRLKHIERHFVDAPSRPGKHGVFTGDMPQVLRWLDETYTLGRRGGRGVAVHKEDGRTVYEVRFSTPVGYIGGRDGGRQHHPEAWQIRLVLDGDKVITAFPF